MIYAISDLHGCFGKFIKMLETINFSDNDTLYILGDIVDRGEDGIKILQYIMDKQNIIPLIGNHDYNAKRCLEKWSAMADTLSDRILTVTALLKMDGGEPTLEAFKKLPDEAKRKVLSFLNTFIIYDELEVNGNKFFMSHTVPEKARMDDFENLTWQEFIFGEPEYEKQYYPDKYIVTGHTSTSFINPDYTGRIYKANNHIAIDCGATFGNPLGCICLDNFEEFYVE